MEQLAGWVVLLILFGIVIGFLSALFRTGNKVAKVLNHKLDQEYRKIEPSQSKNTKQSNKEEVNE